MEDVAKNRCDVLVFTKTDNHCSCIPAYVQPFDEVTVTANVRFCGSKAASFVFCTQAKITKKNVKMKTSKHEKTQ